MSILGVVTGQEMRYQLLSELRVSDPDVEGIRTASQKILETRLVKADPLSQGTNEEALRKLKGWEFSYTLSSDGEVLKMIDGPADAPKAAKVEPAGGRGFRVSSIMDEAGWKELAQLSFYVPDEQASGNKLHLRQMTHDFGPLGSFTGETSFVRKGTQQGLMRIDYTHKLNYRGPAKDAPAGDLPFTIKGAELRPEMAGGSIWYDQKAKRVRQAEEQFRVSGVIAAEIAGMQLEVQVDEAQAIILKLTDVNPWKQ